MIELRRFLKKLCFCEIKKIAAFLHRAQTCVSTYSMFLFIYFLRLDKLSLVFVLAFDESPVSIVNTGNIRANERSKRGLV